MDPKGVGNGVGSVEETISSPTEEVVSLTDIPAFEEESSAPSDPEQPNPTSFLATPGPDPEINKNPMQTSELIVNTAEPTVVPEIPGGSLGGVTKAPEQPQAPLVTSERRCGGKDGLAPGAVAGIAIATSIIGAAIALLVAFLLFKRRDRKDRANAIRLGKYESAPSLARGIPSPYHPVPTMSSSHIPDSHLQESHTAAAPARAPAVIAPVPIRSSTAALEAPLAGVLPPPADRTTIQAKVSDMFSRIHRHIETYYRDVHATITPSMESELAKFGIGDVSLAQLLENASSPTVVLKHALVAYVLGITSPAGDADETLFPKDVLRDNFIVAGNGHGGMSSPMRRSLTMNTNVDAELTNAYILHRRLSAQLYSSLTHPSRLVALQPTMREAAEHFSLTFFPWANPGYGDMEKDVDLVQSISHTLDTVVWLYTQPYLRTEFIWEAHVTNRGTVIFPGLVGVGPSEGTRDVLLEPAVGPS